MTTDFIISVIGALLLVPFVDYVTKDVADDKLKYMIAFVSSVVVGVVAAFAGGQFQKGDMNTVMANLATAFILSQTVFKLYWQNSLAREKFSQRISPSVVDQSVPVAQGGEPAQSSSPEVQA